MTGGYAKTGLSYTCTFNFVTLSLTHPVGSYAIGIKIGNKRVASYIPDHVLQFNLK